MPVSSAAQSQLIAAKTATLSNKTLLTEGDIIRQQLSGLRSIGPASAGQLWIDGIIPYQIDSELSQYSIRTVESAISHWNKVSGITFVPLSDVLETGALSTDSVLFKKNDGCASWVGRQGGQQEVWVGANCSMGSIMHEIGHVLGLEHEHTRPDRDQYITIHWNNITPDKTHNFDVAGTSSKLLGDYDYDSIMHYGPYNFSHSGAPTITPLFGQSSAIGQRIAPSQGDLDAVAQLYAADISIVAHLDKAESGYEASIYIDNNRNQGAHTIAVAVAIDTSGLRAHSNPDWSCEVRSREELVCTLDRLPARASSNVVLKIETESNLTTFEAVVSSKTPDINLRNNSDRSGTSQFDTTGDPLVAAARLQDDESALLLGGANSALWMLLSVFLFRRKH